LRKTSPSGATTVSVEPACGALTAHLTLEAAEATAAMLFLSAASCPRAGAPRQAKIVRRDKAALRLFRLFNMQNPFSV
jgi:hypothetical protein